jgi:ADP-dependent NAD(P)H-hydrate dehydratase / NAD(P)H-hydrate epimerase
VVRASATLSLLTLKPGLYTAEGRDHAGQIWFDSLGLDHQTRAMAAAASGRLIDGSDIGLLWQARKHASHKGSFGDLAVIGGAPGMTGAAWLAARAGLAAGAGRVYVSLLDGEAPMLDPGRPELMGRQAWWLSPPPTLAAATVVCGCGGGKEVGQALPTLLARTGRLLLDADALNILAEDPALIARLYARAGHGLPTVLTPHPLEAARLLGCTTAEVQRDRLAAAQTLADRHRCIVVLKGSGTVVAAPDTLLAINPTGNALLASPGTGDVLAGFIGGLWATRASALAGGAAVTAAAQAACAAVWLHGRAADHEAARSGAALPLRAADLIDQMRVNQGR